ncbi:MAG: TIGR00730 family Rossman fold protein [Verrucomicrobiaceae bacterium]
MPDTVPNNKSPDSEKDFTAGGIFALSEKPPGTTGSKELDKNLHELACQWTPDARSCDLVAGLLMTGLKIGLDNTGMGDLKMIHRALREMRYANKVFHPFRHMRKVTVFGSARTKPGNAEYEAASRFSKKMVEQGFMVITGAGDGIMGAAQHGAGRENSFGLNIRLPFEQQANDIILGDEKLITFNYFFTRKLSFVKEADAFAMFPGGFGTLDELFEATTLIQTGKANILPLVLVDAPGGNYWTTFVSFIREHLLARGLIATEDLRLFHLTDDVDDAVRHIANFYKVFHSYRFVREKMVFRLKHKLSAAAVQKLNVDFADLVKEGKIEQGAALPDEANEEGIFHLPRLIGILRRREFGRLRQLIDCINASELIPAKP